MEPDGTAVGSDWFNERVDQLKHGTGGECSSVNSPSNGVEGPKSFFPQVINRVFEAPVQ